MIFFFVKDEDFKQIKNKRDIYSSYNITQIIYPNVVLKAQNNSINLYYRKTKNPVYDYDPSLLSEKYQAWKNIEFFVIGKRNFLKKLKKYENKKTDIAINTYLKKDINKQKKFKFTLIQMTQSCYVLAKKKVYKLELNSCEPLLIDL